MPRKYFPAHQRLRLKPEGNAKGSMSGNSALARRMIKARNAKLSGNGLSRTRPPFRASGAASHLSDLAISPISQSTSMPTTQLSTSCNQG